MTAPTVNDLPTPPNSDQNQTEFTTNANAHVAALTPWTDEVNTLASWMNDQTNTIVGVGTGFVGAWVDQTGAATIPYSVSNNGVVWTLLTNLADVTASEPTSANSDWLQTTADSSLITVETGSAASVFIGEDAGQADDGQNGCVGIGDNALKSNTSGLNNTAIGRDSLDANTTGGSNSALGQDSLTSNTTGGSNNAFGANSLRSNTTGTQNCAFGNSALNGNTTANGNSAFGHNALNQNSTGSGNCAFGSTTLDANTTGTENSAFGERSLTANITGSRNSAFGRDALLNSTGSDNTAIGQDAGRTITSGSNNTLLGSETDLDATSDNCIVIGYNITETGSNKLNIGDAIKGDLSTGSIGIGTDATSNQLQVGGTAEILDSVNTADYQLQISNTNTSFASSLLRVEQNTSATATAYNLIDCTSGGGATQKFAVRGDGQVTAAGQIISGDVIRSDTDNNDSLGNASFRWSEVFAGNGTINTSDESLKTPFEQLTQTEKEAFLACKALLGKFRWLSAVDKKGDDARIHIGIGAQSAIAEFTSRGLDWTNYSCFCIDDIKVYETQIAEEEKQVTITKQREKHKITIVDGIPTLTVTKEDYEEPKFDEVGVVDEKGNPVMVEVVTGKDKDGKPIKETQQMTHKIPVMETVEVEKQILVNAGQRYGVRYTELLAGIVASMG